MFDGRDRKMFQSKLITRFHHLYLIQAIVELQRHCNKLYSSLKNKLILLISFRFHQLSRSKVLTSIIGKNKQNRNKSPLLSYNNCYYDRADACFENNVTSDNSNDYLLNKQYCNGMVSNGKFLNDLNQLFQMNQLICEGAKSAVSIPMQMLLLPFITVQQSSSTQNNDTHHHNHLYKANINNNNNNKHMFSSAARVDGQNQQWHDVDINKTTSQLNGSQYLINGCQVVTTQPKASDYNYNNLNYYHGFINNQQNRIKLNLPTTTTTAQTGNVCQREESAGITSWKKSQQNWSTSSTNNFNRCRRSLN